MRTILLALLLLCMLHPVMGQNKSKLEYLTQVISNDGPKQTGVLVHLGDSVLHVVPASYVRKGKLKDNAIHYTFAVRNVEQVRIQSKSSVLRGTLLGGGLGLVLGALIGYASYESDCDMINLPYPGPGCYEILDQKGSTILGGTLGAVLGAAIGSIAGSSRKHIDIRGDQATYLSEKEKLQQYVLQK
jgi:hypothetical protein